MGGTQRLSIGSLVKRINLFFQASFFLFLLVRPAFAETAVEYWREGNDFLHQGNFDQAIVEYSKAIDTDPNLAGVYDDRGVAYAQEGSYTRAVDDFTMAIASNPNDADAYNNRAHAYADEGKQESALIDYGMAIRINPIYLNAYKNRAELYFQMKDLDHTWADVFKIEELGGTIDPDFYKELKKAVPHQ